MSYGLGGFFGDFTDSALKTYNMVESNKRAKAQDKRAQDEHDVFMEKANRDKALMDQLTKVGSDNLVYNGPDLPPQGGATTPEFAQQFSPQAMSGIPGMQPPAAPSAAPAAMNFEQAFNPQAMAGFAGMTTPGNIDVHNRPVVKNPDGTISTVRSMSIGTDKGETLIPTVSNDGRIMSDPDAVAAFKQTGQNLGVFKDPTSATAYAKTLHNDQAAEYAPQSQGEMVTVRDPFTNQYHAVPKAQTRPKSVVEQARDIAAVYRANGQPDKALEIINKSLETALNEKTFDKREMADSLTSARANPYEFAKVLSDVNRRVGTNIEVSVENVQGQPVLKFNQPGSAAPPFYLTPTGELSTKPMPGAYSMQSAALVAGMTRDPLSVFRDVVDAQSSVQAMALRAADNRRADNQDARAQGQYQMEQGLYPYRKAAAAAGLEGQMLDNEGRRISNTVTGMDYGIPTGQQYTGGWTPRARNGGDNSDEAVDAKIAGAAKFLGVAPSDDISKIDPTRIAQAMALSEGGAGSLADRNNNPGNLRNADGSFKKFPTKEAGIRAAAELVRRKIASGQSSVQSIIEGLPVGGDASASPARYAGMPITSPKAQAKITSDARDIRKDATKYASDRGDIGTPEFQKAYNQYVAMQVNSLPAPVRPQFISLLSGDIVDLTGGSPSTPTPQPKAPAPAAQSKPRGIPAPSGRQPVALPGGAFYTPSTPPAQGLVSGIAWDRSKKRPVDASLFSK